MSIGSTIKKLRREHNITQEQLAEMLGISTNAVSQWECDKTAPDISNLPLLANIFEVSADILLEIDISKSKKKADIKEFTEKYAELHSQGKTAERVKLSRAMQKKYPNDETVRYYLMRALQHGSIDECFDEIITLGEQLLDSSNSEYKMGAIRGLCFTYLHKNDREKALKYANMMPPAEDLHLHVLEGNELVEHCQNYFLRIGSKMFLYMKYLIDCKDSGYTHDEKYIMWNNLYDVFNIIFSNKDYGFYNDMLVRVCFFMALESGRAERYERAISDLERMLVHLEEFNDFTEINHTSLLINRIKINIKDTTKNGEEPLGLAYLRYINKEDSVFNPIAGDIRYIKIKENLEKICSLQT